MPPLKVSGSTGALGQQTGPARTMVTSIKIMSPIQGETDVSVKPGHGILKCPQPFIKSLFLSRLSPLHHENLKQEENLKRFCANSAMTAALHLLELINMSTSLRTYLGHVTNRSELLLPCMATSPQFQPK